jgi:hypothetical protein
MLFTCVIFVCSKRLTGFDIFVDGTQIHRSRKLIVIWRLADVEPCYDCERATDNPMVTDLGKEKTKKHFCTGTT